MRSTSSITYTTEGAITPLHPEDAVGIPTVDETFILSDLSEDELTQYSSFIHGFCSSVAFALFFGIGLLVVALLL